MPHPPSVLTLVAPPGALDPALVGRVRAALGAGPPDWLSPAEAADLPLAAGHDPAAAADLARALLGDAPVDPLPGPAAGRRRRLLVADMDSTVVEGETLDELAAEAGLGARVAAITARSMNGELDFRAALRERVALLAGLDAAALEATWARTRMMPGAAALVATMRAHGARCALVSGGFTWFTARVAARLGFDAHRANALVVEGGRLAGRVEEPILDRDAKLAALRELAAADGLGLAETLAVGDGANDLAMLGAAGLGVAYRAKPVVAAAARVRVEHGDLTALLWAQGYRAAEIVRG